VTLLLFELCGFFEKNPDLPPCSNEPEGREQEIEYKSKREGIRDRREGISYTHTHTHTHTHTEWI